MIRIQVRSVDVRHVEIAHWRAATTATWQPPRVRSSDAGVHADALRLFFAISLFEFCLYNKASAHTLLRTGVDAKACRCSQTPMAGVLRRRILYKDETSVTPPSHKIICVLFLPAFYLRVKAHSTRK